MGEKVKSRPSDNMHCFKGMGRAYWELRARGFQGIVTKGKDGHFVKLKSEQEILNNKNDPKGPKVPNADGFAMQNGGMYSPQETNMHPGVYYRFFASNGGNPTGHWWLEPQHYFSIRSLAEQRGISLAAAASLCLVIPREWGDCGRLVRALLNTRLHAYVGKGKPATGTVSPDNAARDKTSQPVRVAPAHIEIKQWFVPGEPTLLEKVFNIENTLNVLQKGRAL